MFKTITIATGLFLGAAGVSYADGDGFVAGAGAGAVTGAIVGGPVGAAVGAGVGGIAGGVASDAKKPNTVVIEQPPRRRVIEEDVTGTVPCSSTTVQHENAYGETSTTRRTDCP
jgi:hypothetical protein